MERPRICDGDHLNRAIQHRLAGLGHESSHYSFMKNRYLNDLIPDLFCMFPIMTTIHFYRLFHFGHHQFTNDPDRDPDLQNLGHGKRAGEFPMSRKRFITRVYFCPAGCAISVCSLFVVLCDGQYVGPGSKCLHRAALRRKVRKRFGQDPAGDDSGHPYIAFLSWVLRFLTGTDRAFLLVPAGLAGIALLAMVIRACRVGDLSLAASPGVFDPRGEPDADDLLHDLLVALASSGARPGDESAIYPILLWVVPMPARRSCSLCSCETSTSTPTPTMAG